MEKILIHFAGALEVAISGAPAEPAALNALINPVKMALAHLGAALEAYAARPDRFESWDNSAARHVRQGEAVLVFAELAAAIPVEGGPDALLNAKAVREQVQEQLERALECVAAPLLRAGLQAQTSVVFRLDEEDEHILTKRHRFVNQGAVSFREDAAAVKAQEAMAQRREDAATDRAESFHIPVNFGRA